MRQRKIKNIVEKLERFDKFIVSDPEACRGRWREVFGNDNSVYLEIGCGKGQFVTKYAEGKPEWNFIAVEGHESVVLRALEKTEQKNIDNIKFILQYMRDIEKFFEKGELSGIFLNFSDPWPKDRHAKRRLTHGKKLLEYCRIIKDGGFIEFKTDNELLFEFTMRQIEENNLIVEEISRDLHNSHYASENITTEYEDKFSEAGKNINYVRIRA